MTQGVGAYFASAFAGGAVAGGLSTAFTGGNFLTNFFSGGLTSVTIAAGVYVGYQLYDWATTSGIAQADVPTNEPIRVGAREIAPGLWHKLIERFGFEIIEMGPQGGDIHVYRGGELTANTARALANNEVVWVETRVNSGVFDGLLGAYERTVATGTAYNPLHQNSNYFVNHIVSGAGGNPYVPGVFAPGFAGPSGIPPRFPIVLVPNLARR
jgi:hypothetical protein